MKVCKRCLYTSAHPLGLTFDRDGVCSGCRVHEEKDQIDWAEKNERLGAILSTYKSESRSNYDCVVPVSGARDSFFIVHTLKVGFGLNPLLVHYNNHYNTALGIRNLARLRTLLDCDIMNLVLSPDLVKKITRATLRQLGSMYWHCLAGRTVFPVQVAVRMKVPLIVWGCHQGIDQVGMFSHQDEVEMTHRYRLEHDLMGYDPEALVGDQDQIAESEIQQFIYPSDEELEAVGVRGIYLNNYIRWDTKAQHERMLNLYHYETHAQTRTFDTYNDVDCFMYSDVHDYLKFIKHGYGKVTDHAVRELRFGRLTREEAIERVRTFETKGPAHLEQFTRWLGITDRAFEFVTDQHRHHEIWERDASWEWRRKLNLIDLAAQEEGIEPHRLDLLEDCAFIPGDQDGPYPPDDEFILVGHGKYV